MTMHDDEDRLTPEERAVIEAADRWHACGGRVDHWALPENQSLADAVAAYRKATAPPEPFEAWCVVWADGEKATPFRYDPGPVNGVVWRCTVTPIERVQ